MARMKILSSDEFNSLYKIPKLEDEDRPFVFELDQADLDYIEPLDTPCKIDYILQVVCFRLSQYFFSFTFQGCRKDVWYIIDTYFPEGKFPKKQISKHQAYKNRAAILQKYDMKLYSSEMRPKLDKYAAQLAKKHTLPRYLFDSLLDYCHQHHIVRPGYSVLQEIISTALENEKKRLSDKLKTLLDKPLRDRFKALMEKGDDYYQLTFVKKDQRDFSTEGIGNTLDKQQSLELLYRRSREIIKALGISEQNVHHYAELAVHYTIYGLKTMKNRNLARLYLICYAHSRYLHLADYLIASLSHKVGYFIGESTKHEEQMYQKTLLEDDNNRGVTAKILALFINKRVSNAEIRDKAYKIKPEKQFPQLIKKIKKPNFNGDFHRWNYYGSNAQAIKINLRGIFINIEFQSDNKPLNQAIQFLKQHIACNNTSFDKYCLSDIPMAFVPKKLRRYLFVKSKNSNKSKEGQKVDGDRYEFMLYLQLEKAIGRGAVNIRDSLSHRSLPDELIAEGVWRKDKEKLIDSLNNKLLKTDIQSILAHIKAKLSARYNEVNGRVNDGSNDKIKLTYNKQGEVIKWHLPYKKLDDGVNNPFYEKLPTTSISEVIRYAAKETGFMKHFKHILPNNSKKPADESAVAACVVAKGTGVDTYRMQEICDVKEQDLTSMEENFVRLQNLADANDEIINKVAKLPIFEKYTLADYGVHASVDGQKLETKYNTIKARHSPKYFGLSRGISAYTLFANCLPLCTKTIGANEHESYFLYDILNKNTSDVKIEAVSGDMHSINRVNFALLYFFGYRFMPRFTKIDTRAKSNLVCFEDPKVYKDYIIKPSKQANVELIEQEWDNILRILVTLGLKQNTQSQIVRKLSTYNSNDTLKALIELDKIILSLYMLDYVDDEQIRRNVHRSLNRGESYHQLRSAIAKVSGKKIVGKNEIELSVSNECARLLANCIIFYNATILSKLYEHYKKKKMTKACAKIIRCSPVAWQHLNLIGMYTFRSGEEIINLQGVIENLIADPKINF